MNAIETAKVFMNGRSQAIRIPKWAEIFENFKGDSEFSVRRELLNDKPRDVQRILD